MTTAEFRFGIALACTGLLISMTTLTLVAFNIHP